MKDWNIDKYRYDVIWNEMNKFLNVKFHLFTNRNKFEPEEQWELKRKFMETNKHLFPRQRILCLAQVFVNVEFLGTKYSFVISHQNDK